jgi:hypothetical protein
MGRPVREHTNPAEWMLHIAQTQSQDDLDIFQSMMVNELLRLRSYMTYVA